MTEFNTVLALAKDVKRRINEYNEAEPSMRRDAYEKLQEYIHEILSSPQNRSLIYKGNSTAVVFCRTLGQWRMKIWKEIIEEEIIE